MLSKLVHPHREIAMSALGDNAQTLEVAPGFRIDYMPAFCGRREADEWLEALSALSLTREVIRMFGSDLVTRRRTAQFGVEYSYNPAAKLAAEWSPLMQAIRGRIEPVVGRLDGALVQLYPDGDTAIGWHRDKGNPEVIASVSLGAEREFSFGVGPARSCRETWRMRLAHGSLLLIPEITNRALKHRLVLERQVRTPRVNVTFRRFPVRSR